MLVLVLEVKVADLEVAEVVKLVVLAVAVGEVLKAHHHKISDQKKSSLIFGLKPMPTIKYYKIFHLLIL